MALSDPGEPLGRCDDHGKVKKTEEVTEGMKKSEDEEQEKEEEEEEEEDKKKKRKKKKKDWSEIRLAIEELSLVLQQDENSSTLAFLVVSNLLIQFLDKIGPTMAVLRHDIQRNIERLEDLYVLDPPIYASLLEILKKEVSEGTSRKTDSCSRAILWLTRSIDFNLTLLEILSKDSQLSLDQAVEEAYKTTLKPWHGWISSAAYKVALKLIPERKFFTILLMGKEKNYDTLKSDIQVLVSLLQPLLTELQALLQKFRLDRLKST